MTPKVMDRSGGEDLVLPHITPCDFSGGACSTTTSQETGTCGLLHAFAQRTGLLSHFDLHSAVIKSRSVRQRPAGGEFG
jgi:hypothetical protein